MNISISIFFLVVGCFFAIYSFSIVDKDFKYTDEQFLQSLFSFEKYNDLDKKNKSIVKRVRKYLIVFIISIILVIIVLNNSVLF